MINRFTLKTCSRKTVILLFFILAFTLLGVFYHLFTYRLWPFSTGTNAHAFLGATFEMSLPEAQRALNKDGAELVDRDTFANLDPEINRTLPFIKDFSAGYIFAEDKVAQQNIKYLYMPSIDMFDSQIVGQFEFIKNKLSNIEIRIFPLSKKQASIIVDKIIQELRKKYTLTKKEYANRWVLVDEDSSKTQLKANSSGQYTLEFQSKSSCIHFWINLTDINNPILNISFSMKHNETCASQYLIKVKKREVQAF